jgi:hypothetical protein
MAENPVTQLGGEKYGGDWVAGTQQPQKRKENKNACNMIHTKIRVFSVH